MRADGAAIPAKIPLLANHSRASLDDILGSAREIRREGTDIVARLYFADGDDDAERAWNKVKQGHLDSVSVGYRATEYVDIPAGQSNTVAGKRYTASPERPLRVTTRWIPKEVSAVPIGADPAAKMRDEKTPTTDTRNQESPDMDPQLRAFLEQHGLRSDATDDEAVAFMAALGGNLRARAEAIERGEDDPGEPPAAPPVNNHRGETPAPPADGERTDPPTVEQAAADAIRDERDRVATIRRLAGDDCDPDVVERMIADGVSVTDASPRIIEAIRGRREEESQPISRAPAGHVHNPPTGDEGARALAAGLAIAIGTNDPTGRRFGLGVNDQFTEQDAERGDRFSRLSAIDLVRECLRAETGRHYMDPMAELRPVPGRRAAVSGGTLSYVFTTNVYARLIEGYETIGDTTRGWCDEEDVPNFLTQEDISVDAATRLERLPRGGSAKHATMSDSKETYKIFRYAKQFVADEQDVIDDRLGAIMRMPYEMGAEAARVRPDLVYSLILENPSLVADSTEVFHADHSNLDSNALTSANLKTGISAVGKQRSSANKVLNIVPRYLLVPAALEWNALELTHGAALAKLFTDGDGDPSYSTHNLIADRKLVVVVDDRLGATGVTDPRSGNIRTGSDSTWYLTAGRTKGVRVAYLRGTGRLPALRSFALTQGQWGQGWDINLDIGAAFLDYREFYKSAG